MFKFTYSVFLLSLLSIINSQLIAQSTQDILSQKVYFYHTTTNYSKGSEAVLDELGEYLKSHPDMIIKIKGYSCNMLSGNEALGISKERIMAVRKHLVSKGAKMSQLQAQSLGTQNPLQSNDTEYGRIKNRRVEFELVSN